MLSPYRFLHAGLCAVLVCSAGAEPAAPESPADPGIHGGLIVQWGARDAKTPAALSLTGRYVIHLLDTDAAAVRSAQAHLQAHGRYGLASAEHVAQSLRLPYTENLVNLFIAESGGPAPSEIFRVLTPGGLLRARPAAGLAARLEQAGFENIREESGQVLAYKPWPATMDTWSHPRHAANGNAVSTDTEVGPPERIRWVAAATQEVEGMVTANGRNYYGGILARDSFNGLRLWERDLARPDAQPLAWKMHRLSRDRARPVAASDVVFAVAGGSLVSLDASTGETRVRFPTTTPPTEAIHHRDIVVVTCANEVIAFHALNGQVHWRHPASTARNVAASEEMVSFIRGNPKRGEALEAVAVDLYAGTIKWRQARYPWLKDVDRTVAYGSRIAYELSTFNDHDTGNQMYIVSAKTGEVAWSKAYPPGMNHHRQARAMFVEDSLWILHGGKINTAIKKDAKRIPIAVSALDPETGETRATHPAGLAHCFPPVATPNYVFAGVLDMTDLKSGEIIANRITKANCSSENGWIPANGLIYTTPKHCTCWPMLRGYVAMAPRAAKEAAPAGPPDPASFPLMRGPAQPDSAAAGPGDADWPMYRKDRWRSGSTTAPGPRSLKPHWSVDLASAAERAADKPGPVLFDWIENPYVKGPLSAPTIAGGLVYVARPDAHEVVALDRESGEIRWRFTANGRIDTPPTLHRGLCLFGTHAGYVHALRADTGKTAWRFRAAPHEERLVAYGQVESPWPVAGSVLVRGDNAYFTAGRQPLADGGILLFNLNVNTGACAWVHRLDTVPQKGFYENSGLEFDPVDLLHDEGDEIAMSRWLFSRDGKTMRVNKWNAFARLDTGEGAAWVPRGFWTYGPRHMDRFPGEAERRPLCVFRGRTVFGALNGSTELYRRDFTEEESFQSKWITGWEFSRAGREGKKLFRSYRIAEKAGWKNDPYQVEALPDAPGKSTVKYPQQFNEIYGMALAGNELLYTVHKDGRLAAISTEDGSPSAELKLPSPAWDGLALAGGRLYLSTAAGRLICVGE